MNLAVLKISKLAAWAFCLLIFPLTVAAQSTDQNFPTPVTTNEINGTIRARDIGDSRLTSYFYAFDGGQGDIFINVASKNFSGDIDVFTADTLQPLTKMVIYADAGSNETGRLIYLRKGERLILRIEGRTPNDDSASFQIKFGGSFLALAPEKTDAAPTIEKNDVSRESSVTVNSVGTIVEIKPKPTPVRKTEETAKEITHPAKAEEKKTEIPKSVPVKTEEDSTPAKTDQAKAEPPPVKPEEDLPSAKTADETKTETVFENKSAKVTVEPISIAETKTAVKSPPRSRTGSRRSVAPAKTAPKVPGVDGEKAPDPLASVRLVIETKDGKTVWLRMSDVLKLSVDKGVMTVIGKDGSIIRYSILDVAKVTIQ